MMTYDDAAEMTKGFEGYSPTVYLDSLGIPTIGYGFALHVGARMPGNILEDLFRYKYIEAIDGFRSLELDLDMVRTAVVIDMIYNMGLTRFKTFRRFLLALRDKDYGLAAYEMVSSKWYRQTKSRAVKLVEMMATGVCAPQSFAVRK